MNQQWGYLLLQTEKAGHKLEPDLSLSLESFTWNRHTSSKRMKNSILWQFWIQNWKKKLGVKPKPDSYFLFFCGFGLFKETAFEFPKWLFFFCSFGHPVANLGFVSFWKIQGILKKKIFGGLWSNGTMQTDLLHKMMLVTPTRQEYTWRHAH